MTYGFDFRVPLRYIDVLGRGLVVTLEITGISIAIGLVLGLLIAILRISRKTVVNGVAAAYIEVFRCTPTLIQIVWIFYCLPIVLGIELSGFASGVVALSLNVAAFYAEAFRTGIQAVKSDQYDAAVALGFSRLQALRHIIIPQAVIISIPVILSNSVSLFKESSLVSTVAIADLMYQGRLLATTTYRPIEVLTTVALIYFVISFPVTQLVRSLETRIHARMNR
jgi:polar amino acid transport system permease protein